MTRNKYQIMVISNETGSCIQLSDPHTWDELKAVYEDYAFHYPDDELKITKAQEESISLIVSKADAMRIRTALTTIMLGFEKGSSSREMWERIRTDVINQINAQRED